jgi:hypothetical protein
MHPGGTLIIKSNAGVDCTKSFDNLAHTNNPEVSSLLTRYFIGHLSPKQDYRDKDVSTLHDLWSAYLRTTVETLVAHQFEMNDIMGDTLDAPSKDDPNGITNIWQREDLPNIIAIRTFYGYQSRLLQGGFAALFGPKLEELVLRLSFVFANAGGPGAAYKLPDILGVIARAKTSPDAALITKEISSLGDFICDPTSQLRFQERGVFSYTAKCVQLDIELLEDLRQEACNGMDAFDNVASMLDHSDPDTTPLAALSTFLLRTLEKMAHRLAMFYAQLARLSVYQPELEHNPARTRWAFVRKCIRDGTFFVLTREVSSEAMMEQSDFYTSSQKTNFDEVVTQINHRISMAVEEVQPAPEPSSVNAIHQERGNNFTNTTTVDSAAERLNVGAVSSMSSFIQKNKTAIRRLSSMPSAYQLQNLQTALTLDPNALLAANNQMLSARMMMMTGYASTPSVSSRTSSPSSRRTSVSFGGSSATSSLPYSSGGESLLKMEGLNKRSRTQSVAASSRQSMSMASSAAERRSMSVSSLRMSRNLSMSGIGNGNGSRGRTQETMSGQEQGHLREGSASKLLALKLGALAEQRRSFY